jgi:hypothetical protein
MAFVFIISDKFRYKECVDYIKARIKIFVLHYKNQLNINNARQF